MPLVHRESYDHAVSGVHMPGKIYVHTEGLETIYDGNSENAIDYFFTSVCPAINSGLRKTAFPTDALYSLSVVWGLAEPKQRRADVFFFRGFDSKWPGNPEVISAIFANGMHVPSLGIIGCADGMIMLGAEEKLRRAKNSLQEFLNSEVSIKDLPWID